MENFMSEDSKLQQAVLDELSWDPRVSAAHIGVSAAAGVVTLTGYVENYAAKHEAENAVRRVKGVRAVAEEMQVHLPMDTGRSDTDIAGAAIERLSWNVAVPKDAIIVSVEQGWVVLSGQVDSWHQKDAAEEDVRRLWGVVGVSNQVTIKPSVDTANLSDDITHALHRSWFFDPDNVHVTAKGGHVKLTGTVGSFHEFQTAAATAWSAPGAISVENDLAVV